MGREFNDEACPSKFPFRYLYHSRNSWSQIKHKYDYKLYFIYFLFSFDLVLITTYFVCSLFQGTRS